MRGLKDRAVHPGADSSSGSQPVAALPPLAGFAIRATRGRFNPRMSPRHSQVPFSCSR